jgi:hypothetical protein
MAAFLYHYFREIQTENVHWSSQGMNEKGTMAYSMQILSAGT